jgi:hypothetical protein
MGGVPGGAGQDGKPAAVTAQDALPGMEPPPPPPRDPPHTCHRTRCDVTVPPRMFMCRDDWRLLTPGLRREIWRTYVPGQETTKTPTAEYLAAARAAIAYLGPKP